MMEAGSVMVSIANETMADRCVMGYLAEVRNCEIQARRYCTCRRESQPRIHTRRWLIVGTGNTQLGDSQAEHACVCKCIAARRCP